MKKFKLKKGDQIIVIAGKDKGKKSEITKVITKKDKIIAKNVNLVKKHLKNNPQTGQKAQIKDIELPIHISNVALLDAKTLKPTKVGFKIENGKKVRFAKKSGENI